MQQEKDKRALAEQVRNQTLKKTNIETRLVTALYSLLYPQFYKLALLINGFFFRGATVQTMFAPRTRRKEF